jgi:hypothetical protein
MLFIVLEEIPHMANTALIEQSDILRVLTTGDVIALPDGTQALQVYLVLNPASEKTYPAGGVAFPAHLRMGDATWAIEDAMVLPARETTINEQRAAQGQEAITAPSSIYAVFAAEATQGTPVEASTMFGGSSSFTATPDAPQTPSDAPTEADDSAAQNAAEQLPETPTTAQLETPADAPTPLSTTPIIVTMKDA